MGFFTGITSTIGSVIGGATKAASKWGGKAVAAYGAYKSGNILGMIGQVGSSLMEKKAGSGEAPNLRMKTVDADTLNAEWEHRLEKGFRKQKLFT